MDHSHATSHLSANPAFTSFDSAHCIPRQCAQREYHDGCSQQSSIVAALKERIRQLEIEAAIAKFEKGKLEDGLQLVVCLLSKKQATSAGYTSKSFSDSSQQAAESSPLSSFSSCNAESCKNSPPKVVPVKVDASAVITTSAALKVPPGPKPAPKPEQSWNAQNQESVAVDLIDISDEGYVSYFSSAEHAGEKGQSTLPKALFAAVSLSTHSALCTVSNAMNQPGKPSLEGIHDLSPHMIDNSSNDGDEEDNISELDLQATRNVEKLTSFVTGKDKLAELSLRELEVAATRIPLMKQDQTTGYIQQTTAAKFDKSFPIKPKCDINYLWYKPPTDAPEVYRTVLVSNLPSKIRPEEILDKVQGGLVVSIKALDTSVITGSATATVEFLYELAARTFQTYASQTKLKIGGNTVEVKVLKTPSWPIPSFLRSLIISGRSTRIMLIHNYPKHIAVDKLREDMGMNTATKISTLLYVRMRPAGTAEIGFSSVLSAQIARDCLIAHGRYRECPIRFAPDPCALPYPPNFGCTEKENVNPIAGITEGLGAAAMPINNPGADEKPSKAQATTFEHDLDSVQLLDDIKGNVDTGFDAAQQSKPSTHGPLTLPPKTSSTVEAMQEFCAAGCRASAEHVQAMCINAWRQSLL